MSNEMAKVARHIINAILRWANMLDCRLKVRPIYFGFTFLTEIPRVWLSLFPTLTLWNVCII